MPQVGKRQFAYTKEGEEEAAAYAAETGQEVVQQDSYGYARGGTVPISDEAFKELDSFVSPQEGSDVMDMDVGKWLKSKAFTEWLATEWQSSDTDMTKAVVRAIRSSFDDEEEGWEMARRFVDQVAVNKAGNPYREMGKQHGGHVGQFGY